MSKENEQKLKDFEAAMRAVESSTKDQIKRERSKERIVMGGTPVRTAMIGGDPEPASRAGLEYLASGKIQSPFRASRVFTTWIRDVDVCLAALESIAGRVRLAGAQVRRVVLSEAGMKVYQGLLSSKERLILAGSPQEATGASLRRAWMSQGDFEVASSADIGAETCLVEAVDAREPRQLGRLEISIIAETAWRCACAFARARGSINRPSEQALAVVLEQPREIVARMAREIAAGSYRREEGLVVSEYLEDPVVNRLFLETAAGMIRCELDIA